MSAAATVSIASPPWDAERAEPAVALRQVGAPIRPDAPIPRARPLALARHAAGSDPLLGEAPRRRRLWPAACAMSG